MDAILISLIGLALTILACWSLFEYLRFSVTGKRVTGTVVQQRWEESSNGRNARFYRIKVAFQAIDGKDIEAEAKSNRPAKVGEQVPVIYLPRDPAKTAINTPAGRNPWGRVAFTAFSLVFMSVGLSQAVHSNILSRTLGSTPGLVCAGLLVAVAGGFGIRHSLRFNRTGERVAGTVVKHRQDDDTVRLTVLFHTLDGQVIRTETRMSASGWNPKPGKQVTVIYDPRNPSRAELAGRARWTPVLWLFVILAGLSVVVLILSKGTAGQS